MKNLINAISQGIDTKKKIQLILHPTKRRITIEPHLLGTNIFDDSVVCRAWINYDGRQYWKNFKIEHSELGDILKEDFSLREGYIEGKPQYLDIIAEIDH